MKLQQYLLISIMAFAQSSHSNQVYRIPKFGVELEIPQKTSVGDPGIILFGDIFSDAGKGKGKAFMRDFGLDPEYSKKYFIGGVFYRTQLRIALLTSTAKMRENWGERMFGWNEKEKPALHFYPFEPAFASNLVRAVTMLYLHSPVAWEQTTTIQVAGKNGVFVKGWDHRLGKGSDFFQELWAIPIADEQILLIHAGYFKMRAKQVEEQRKIIAGIVKSLRSTTIANQ